MTTVKRPHRLFSFTDWTKSHPREQHPGDRLDAMFIELIEAIATTQDALAQIRAPDGRLKNQSIGPEHFRSNLVEDVTDRIRLVVEPLSATMLRATDAVRDLERNAALYAKDAEAAVDVAKGLVAGLAPITRNITASLAYNSKSADAADSSATDSENWANYSQAMADNAIKAKDEALQWAEYLAGPVVDSLKAPDYIANSPFPHGLYYAPVEGGLAGLWSAKWWALYAQQLVGKASVYYIGPWDHAPLPGETNPATGETVPSPLAPGSLYYDTVTQTLNVWNGTGWSQPVAYAKGYLASFIYIATAGQQDFSGADSTGAAPVVGGAPSDAFVNGVRLVVNSDFTVDDASNTLHIMSPLTAGSTVQWDLLVSGGTTTPGAVTAYKIHTLTPNGTAQDFTLQYTDPVGGGTLDADVSDGAQLQVSLDGVIQEFGADYSATGNTLHMQAPPLATSHLWAVWYKPGVAP